LYQYVIILRWYSSLDDATKATWDCSFCQGKKLDIPRNCNNKFSPCAIIINGDTLLTQCPLTVPPKECAEVYSVLKSTLLADMGTGCLPSTLNVLFVYKDIILKAESASKRSNDGK